jgi:hypothetical protein
MIHVCMHALLLHGMLPTGHAVAIPAYKPHLPKCIRKCLLATRLAFFTAVQTCGHAPCCPPWALLLAGSTCSANNGDVHSG